MINRIAEAASRLVVYIHNNNFEALITSGQSAELLLIPFLSEAWQRQYPGEHMPAIFAFIYIFFNFHFYLFQSAKFKDCVINHLRIFLHSF